MKKRVGPNVPDRALELLIEGKKNDFAHNLPAVAKPAAADVAKAEQLEASRAAVVSKAADQAVKDAIASLKKVLSPLFPADALELVARNNKSAIVERPDFALIRAETDGKKTEVARIVTQARLAVLEADCKLDEEIARTLKEPAGTKTAELERDARELLPKTPRPRSWSTCWTSCRATTRRAC